VPVSNCDLPFSVDSRVNDERFDSPHETSSSTIALSDQGDQWSEL